MMALFRTLSFVCLAFLLAGEALAPPPIPDSINGRFGAPTLSSFLSLSPQQRGAYTRARSRLDDPRFVDRGDHYSSNCFYLNRGRAEFERVAQQIASALKDAYRGVSIGRSPTPLLFYLRGWFYARSSDVQLNDFPFSWGTSENPTASDRRLLRAHLRRNGLSPQQISQAPGPIVLFDTMYSGRGVTVLFEELVRWALELGMLDEMKRNLHYIGLYPPEMIAREKLDHIALLSLKESRWGTGVASDDDVLKQMDNETMPRGESAKKACSKVMGIRISDAFYIYTGHHSHQSHESFTRDLWEEDVTDSVPLPFAGGASNPALLEAYFLTVAGNNDGHSKMGCEDQVVSWTDDRPKPVNRGPWGGGGLI